MNPVPVYCALVHHPVLDKDGGIVSTSVTNLDVHDIARACRTYEVRGYYVVAPLDVQRRLVVQIARHWISGSGAKRAPNRGEALSLVRTAADLESAKSLIKDECGGLSPLVWVTCARRTDKPISYAEARKRLEAAERPVLVVFGTGYGLSGEIIEKADAVLEAVGNPEKWNHLSVRCAAAIVIDRLLSDEV